MGTPRRTGPSLSKREVSLRGELATGIGESVAAGTQNKKQNDSRRAEGTRRKVFRRMAQSAY